MKENIWGKREDGVDSTNHHLECVDVMAVFLLYLCLLFFFLLLAFCVDRYVTTFSTPSAVASTTSTSFVIFQALLSFLVAVDN